MEKESLNKLLNFSIINIDKPSGPTSFKVSQFVKKSLGLKKTAHMGTLDPQVSGVLPVTLGRACKLSEVLMHRNKKYVGIMRLHEDISLSDLKELIKEFIGKINQMPPVRSAVKRALREKEVFSFNILEKSGKDILFDCEVQAGTYIRTIIHDLGKKLPNQAGAHMLELRRTQAGFFTESSGQIFTLYELESAVEEYKSGNPKKLNSMLIPAESAIKSLLPTLQISPKSEKQLLNGKPLMSPDLDKKSKLPNENVFALFNKKKLIGIYKKIEKQPDSDIIAKPEFIYN